MEPNSRFDAQLRELTAELMSMNALCRDCLKAIGTALRSGEVSAAELVQQLSYEIGRHERDIESLCLKILLQRHPVASDLRRVSSALKMITDLQRIGHQSSDMAEILTTETKMPRGQLALLADLSDKVLEMFDAAIAASVTSDADAAREVMASDDEIDAAFDVLRSRLAAAIRDPACPDPGQLLNVLMLGKYFERIADHIVILCRWVIFSVTGSRFDSPTPVEGFADGEGAPPAKTSEQA